MGKHSKRTEYRFTRLVNRLVEDFDWDPRNARTREALSMKGDPIWRITDKRERRFAWATLAVAFAALAFASCNPWF